MANRWFNPDEQFYDGAGNPLSGAQLFFYATGTSTKQNTYSDSGLTIANTNPVVLDSSGRAGSIFLQNLKYKVVLAPSTDTDPPTSPIWTMDPVYTSDVSTVAQFNSGSGNPNGNVAGTQGSAGVPASVYWDDVNFILYVCTTTGNAAGAVWTAVNPASTAAVVPPPQGRLTLVSNTPVMSSDQSAATTVYYTPYNGLLVPIYNGTNIVPTSIVSQLSLGLSSSHAADNIYDLYIFSLSGTPTLGTGPSWSAGTSGNITAGSCARGTGAGGAALAYVGGVLTNAVSMTARYGPAGGSTTTVAANQGTYVGTIYIDHTAGQVTCHVTFGQNRKFGLWNAYNRVPIALQAGDSTATWTYTTATIRASNNAPSSYSGLSFNVGSGTTCNGLTVLEGLPEESINVFLEQGTGVGTPGAAAYSIGIGLNATTAYNGLVGNTTANNGGTSANPVNVNTANVLPPSLGINVLCSLEKGSSAAGSVFEGTSANMLLQATWRG